MVGLDSTDYISPWPMDWMLGPVNRGHWRHTATLEERGGTFASSGVLFSYLGPVALYAGVLAVLSRGGSLVGQQALSNTCSHWLAKGLNLSFFTISFPFSSKDSFSSLQSLLQSPPLPLSAVNHLLHS